MTFPLIIGALLHDIGKFVQRAGGRLDEKQQILAARCCPKSQEGVTHLHVLHGAQFITDLLGAKYREAADAVLYHHRPDTAEDPYSAYLLALADRLSNGVTKPPEDKETLPEASCAQLCSIFTRLPSGDQKPSPHFFPLTALTEDMRNHIPEKETKTQQGNPYATLWSHFVAESQRLDVSNKERLLRQLLCLLEKHTLFIPASTDPVGNDVTLFHHLKTTAAIASCLTQLEVETSNLSKILAAVEHGGPEKLLAQQAFYLVGCDLSGIQSFIYSVASKGALKGLRGRSVYLTAIVEIVAESLLAELGLNPSNIIYCGGGHAYLLVPKSNTAITILLTKQHRVNQIINDAHKGRLALAIAWQPMRFCDFFGSAYAKVWEALGAELARGKRRKASQFFTDETTMQSFLGPFPALGDEKACKVCGDTVAGPAWEEGDEDFHCPLCKSFESLSKDVALARYVGIQLLQTAPQKKALADCTDILKAIGGSYEFYPENTTPGSVFLLNKTDFLETDRRFLGFHFMGKHTPLAENNQLEDLESLAGKARGLEKWGVLRADVDDLGKTMRQGVGDENNTIARLSTLSHLTGLFFSAQPQMHIHGSSYRQGISLVYAGGDDLFVIGAWSLLPGLAEIIQKDFSAFTSGAMDLSAGIFISPTTGYPVYQAAALAGEAESEAKDKGKSRLCLFNATIPWSDLKGITDIKDSLVTLLEKKECPRSLLAMLYAGYENQLLAHSGKSSRFKLWRLYYALGRLMQRYKGLRPEIETLESLLIQNYWMPLHCNVSIRWAEYLTRRKENATHEQAATAKTDG
jgi:CRISPR-associated protein Csm1